jgi:hypothetical protein
MSLSSMGGHHTMLFLGVATAIPAKYGSLAMLNR